MSAGLPGLGLGGLFFILSALALPLFELARTARGESSAQSWLAVARQFGLAVAMIAAIDAVFRLLDALVAGDAPGGGGLLAMPIGPVLVTIGILAMVLAGAKALQLLAWLRTARAARASSSTAPLRATLLAPIRPTMRRAVGACGALAPHGPRGDNGRRAAAVRRPSPRGRPRRRARDLGPGDPRARSRDLSTRASRRGARPARPRA